MLVAQEYEPATTGVGPNGFSTPVRLSVAADAGALEGYLGDDATRPEDRDLRSWGDRPPGGGGEVWWLVTGHFDDPAAATCRFDGTEPDRAREICRNRLFVERMRVVIELHDVQPGESLESIAATRGTSLQALLDANPWIHDRGSVLPGDRLVIPRPSGVPTG